MAVVASFLKSEMWILFSYYPLILELERVLLSKNRETYYVKWQFYLGGLGIQYLLVQLWIKSKIFSQRIIHLNTFSHYILGSTTTGVEYWRRICFMKLFLDWTVGQKCSWTLKLFKFTSELVSVQLWILSPSFAWSYKNKFTSTR